jgi:hypothetical protein
MCTVTIVPIDDGFRMMCNRDERRTRPAALPPALHHVGARLAAFPVDPQGGGTWVGVNDAGVAVALLNRNGSQEIPLPDSAQSRGLLVRRLLEASSVATATDALRRADLALFQPFRLVVAQGPDALLAESDGRTLFEEPVSLTSPLLLTSSSLGDALVDAPRRRLFDRMVLQRPAQWREGQLRFHRHQWRARPHLSVLMDRADARTVSRTTVDVTRHRRRLGYEDLTARDSRPVRIAWCSCP